MLPRLRAALGWVAVAALVALGGASAIFNGGLMGLERSSQSVVPLGVGVIAWIALAFAVRARSGPPTTIEGAMLVGSLPVLVLAIAVVGWRFEVGYSTPVPLFREQEAHDLARETGVWAVSASVALVTMFLASAAVVLDWARWTASGRGVARALGVIIAIAALVLFLALAWQRELPSHLRFVEQLFDELRVRSEGVRASFAASSGVCVLAVALLAAGRTQDPRRMILGTLFAAAAVCFASYGEAVQNEFAGFFCFQEPPGPASRWASALASHRVTIGLAALCALPVLAVGALLTWRARSRLTHRDFVVAAAVVLLSVLPAAGAIAGWQHERLELIALHDPQNAATHAGVRLPSIPSQPAWWTWHGDYRWPWVIADAGGVRAAQGGLTWSELRTAAGARRLRRWVRSNDDGPRWHDEPDGVRVLADRELPVARVAELAMVAELDGFTLAVSAPASPYYDGLAIAERESRRLIVWVGSPPSQQDGSSRYHVGSEDVVPEWLERARILVDRPARGISLGAWIERMHHAATRDEWQLVMLDPS